MSQCPPTIGACQIASAFAQADARRHDTQGSAMTNQPSGPQQPPATGWQPPQNPQPWMQPAPGQQTYWQQVQPAPTNGLAIAALITAFFFAPVGVVLGIIALSQIKKSNGAQGGQGLAIAGIVVGSVLTLVAWVPMLISAIALLGSATDGVGAMAGLL